MLGHRRQGPTKDGTSSTRSCKTRKLATRARASPAAGHPIMHLGQVPRALLRPPRADTQAAPPPQPTANPIFLPDYLCSLRQAFLPQLKLVTGFANQRLLHERRGLSASFKSSSTKNGGCGPCHRMSVQHPCVASTTYEPTYLPRMQHLLQEHAHALAHPTPDGLIWTTHAAPPCMSAVSYRHML